LFKFFGFVQSTAHVNKNGIGLGLVISEKIVRKFGGEIGFKSVPFPQEGHGATFTFTFRLHLRELKEEHKEQSMVRELNSKHILFDYQPTPEEKKEGEFTVPSEEDNEAGLTRQI